MSLRKLVIAAVVAIVAIVALVMFGNKADAEPICHLEIFEGVATAHDCAQETIVVTNQYKDGVPPGSALVETFPQTLFDSGIGSADLPSCAWQADVLKPGTALIEHIDANHLYGDAQAGEAVHGGEIACVAATTTTTATTVPDEVSPTTIKPPVTLPRTGPPQRSGAMTVFAIGLFGIGIGSLGLAEARRLKIYLKSRR